MHRACHSSRASAGGDAHAHKLVTLTARGARTTQAVTSEDKSGDHHEGHTKGNARAGPGCPPVEEPILETRKPKLRRGKGDGEAHLITVNPTSINTLWQAAGEIRADVIFVQELKTMDLDSLRGQCRRRKLNVVASR